MHRVFADGTGHHLSGILARDAYSGHIKSLLSGKFLCRRCGEYKYLTDMRPDFRFMCLKCSSKSGNEWQNNNHEASLKYKRRYALMKHYGLTLDEYLAILDSQGCACAICRENIKDPFSKSAHVDHDHKTHKVRGILCDVCNLGLGSFKDNVGFLNAAVDYLIRTKEISALERIRINESIVSTSATCASDSIVYQAF